MFKPDSLNVIAVVNTGDVSYVVYQDGSFTHAVSEWDWNHATDCDWADYNEWCSAVPAVADADLARKIIAASDGDVTIIHLGGTCVAVTA